MNAAAGLIEVPPHGPDHPPDFPEQAEKIPRVLRPLDLPDDIQEARQLEPRVAVRPVAGQPLDPVPGGRVVRLEPGRQDGEPAVYPAMIPLDVTAVGADFYTANLHKWLLAPTGAGFLAIGPGNEDRLQPLHVSWGYHPDRYPLGICAPSPDPDAADAYGSTPRVRFLEFEGSRDVCPWLVVPDAIALQAALGWDAIRRRFAELSAYTRDRVRLPPATPAAAAFSGAMTAFEVPARTNPVALRRELWAARIEIPVIERPDRLLLRVSHHWYTTEAEIDTLAAFVARRFG